MPFSSPQIFDLYARDYDAPRHRLVPDFDNFYGALARQRAFQRLG